MGDEYDDLITISDFVFQVKGLLWFSNECSITSHELEIVFCSEEDIDYLLQLERPKASALVAVVDILIHHLFDSHLSN